MTLGGVIPATGGATGGLAVDGGTPVRTRPLRGWPTFSDQEAAAVEDVLRSGRVNYWTGAEGRSFEREFAAVVGVRHGVAVSNGTVALELALRALGIGPGDEVVVPARTFVASASSVVAVGARPVVADVDRDSGNVTADTVAAVAGPRTRAIAVVHLGGWPADMDPLLAFASRRDLYVVEDGAQAHGATYHGRPVGSLGHAAAWSFCNDKILSTGEGGMVTTDDPALWRSVWSYKEHGKDPDGVRAPQEAVGFRWQHHSFGSNARMHELAAAIGRIALGRLPLWCAARRQNADVLVTRLEGLPGLRVPRPAAGIGASYYRAYAYVRPERLRPGWGRDRILSALLAEGVPATVGSCGEIYLERAFGPELRPRFRLPVARDLAGTSLAFPVHPTLSTGDMQDIAEAVAKVLAVATA